MSDIIDIDTGAIISGEKTIEEMGTEDIGVLYQSCKRRNHHLKQSFKPG